MTEMSVKAALSTDVDGIAPRSYVLLTAARNEEAYIAAVIESVVAQSERPLKWVIVSDRSTDATDEIAQSYSRKHPFIEVLRVTESASRGTPSKVYALNAGRKRLGGMKYAFIGNLDCDVLLPSNYYEALLDKFLVETELGVAGGTICESANGRFQSRQTNRSFSVAHAAELVRTGCFQEVGGYFPLKYGGEDWLAEVSARMHGWKTRSFDHLEVQHLRPTGTADTWRRYNFREGQADYSFGSLALFELFKCLARFGEKPRIVGAITRMTGYCWSWLRREPFLVPNEVVVFLQNEQRRRMFRLFSVGNQSVSAWTDV